MTPLPVDASLPRILDALAQVNAVVVLAPPGAGKTTRIPPAIVESGLLPASHPGVVVLQPRRVAARSTATRIAAERAWTLGEEVGFQVRHERRTSSRTRLRVQTEGILTRQLLADPFLEGIGAVVLDEFHERSLHTDLALALLREVRREVRPDLRLIVMSATLDPAGVARFLDDCPIVEIPGRSFPVEIEYRPATPESLTPVLRELLADRRDAGHILTFLPGMAEIRRVEQAIRPAADSAGAVVLPLHGSLPAEQQDLALRPSDRRKLILATNVAETSLTIDGVTAVVDSGLARVAHYDPRRGFDRLELTRISQASAAQRAGRAGRTGPGRCIRMWSEGQQNGLAPFERPEIERVDLCEAALTLHSWGMTQPARFAWYEPPAPERLEAAGTLLAGLGAVEEGRITPLGRRMLDLPIHPRLGRLLLAAHAAGRLEEGAALAALLSEKDILSGQGDGPARTPAHRRSDRGRSDILVRLDLLAEAEAARFAPALHSRGIDPAAARQVARIRDDLVRSAGRRPGGTAPHVSGVGENEGDDALLRWLLLAYPDRVVRRRGAEATGVMTGGRGVRLARESVVRDAALFLALDPREERRQGTLELQVRLASAVELTWLEELFPDAVRRGRSSRYDVEKGRVVAVVGLWYRDLLLREDASRTPDSTEAAAVLFEALRPQATSFFLDDPAASSWLARLDFLRRSIPELDWPEFRDEDFAGLLEPLCQGRSRLEEVRSADKLPYLEGRLGPALARELAVGAPVSFQLPSGRNVKLTYEPDRPPVLAAKLQELFGWTESPRLARGRVPVLLHLLGPNYRPVQITSDLASFWSTTYHQVRKDLRGRYPRHPWPDDPTTAPPQQPGRPRRD